MPRKIQAGQTSLSLRGQGVLTYALVFDVYLAELYLPVEALSEDVLGDVAKILELHYYCEISAKDIIASKKERLSRNWPRDLLAIEHEKLERMNRAYVDVKPGDVYALTCLPGRGTELSLNGKPEVTVPGARFAAMMFSIWLGKEPLDKELRDVLLGYD